MSAPQNFRSSMHGFNREDVVHYLEYLNAKYTAQLNQLNSDKDALQKTVSELQEKVEASSGLTDQTAELETLREQLKTAREETARLEEKCAELEQQQSGRPSQEEADRLKEELTSVGQERDALKAQCSDLQQQLEDQKLLPVGIDPEELSRLHAMLDNSTAENAALRAQCADLRQQLNAAPEKAPEASMAEQELEAYRRAERAERVATQRADQVYHRVNLVLDNANGKIEGVSAELSDAADRFNAQLTQMQSVITAGKVALGEAVKTMYALRSDEDSRP